MLSFFAWSYTAYDIGAVRQTVFGIACGDSTGEALVDDSSMSTDAEILNGVFIRPKSSMG